MACGWPHSFASSSSVWLRQWPCAWSETTGTWDVLGDGFDTRTVTSTGRCRTDRWRFFRLSFIGPDLFVVIGQRHGSITLSSSNSCPFFFFALLFGCCYSCPHERILCCFLHESVHPRTRFWLVSRAIGPVPMPQIILPPGEFLNLWVVDMIYLQRTR